MSASQGLQNALNYMREMSVSEGRVYHQYVPVVTDSTTIGEFGQPILDASNLNVMNDFVGLLQKIVFQAVYNKTFNNPLAELEGERLPLGQFIEDIYVNPAKARQFNVNDFAGLLQKYEADVAVQHLAVNSDLQYCVTLTRDKIRNAFTSWNALEDLISGYINSLYNGAYIDMYQNTKALVAGAYAGNKVQVVTVSDVTDEATAKALIRQIRSTFSKMKLPSTKFNAWSKMQADGHALKVWSDPEDIVVMISADLDAMVSVEVLAKAFNMSETDFLGRVIVVDDFNVYNADGSVAVDGSAIKCMIADRAWFKIKTQDFDMSDFFNPNNRTWNYYLNIVKMYNYSFFANAVVFATALPTVNATDIDFDENAPTTVVAGKKIRARVITKPVNATSTIAYTSSATSYATVTADSADPRIAVITGVAEGSATITATCNGHTDTLAVTVSAAA